MSVVSNLYAAKLYSEHPIAIWPLDDDVSYISLITNQQRTFESASPYAGWTITNGTADDGLPLPDEGSPRHDPDGAGTGARRAVLRGQRPAGTPHRHRRRCPDHSRRAGLSAEHPPSQRAQRHDRPRRQLQHLQGSPRAGGDEPVGGS